MMGREVLFAKTVWRAHGLQICKWLFLLIILLSVGYTLVNFTRYFAICNFFFSPLLRSYSGYRVASTSRHG